MNYKILTDSCCDFPSGMYEQLDLAMVPLSVEFQGKVYDDKNDDSLKELYSGLRCGDAAKTSAVNPARWGTAMEAILSQIGPTVDVIERICPVYNFKAGEE